MNKQELEKILEDTFNCECINGNEEIKQFIFETIIPEVLKSIMINPEGFTDYDYNSELKRQAKELFGIEL